MASPNADKETSQIQMNSLLQVDKSRSHIITDTGAYISIEKSRSCPLGSPGAEQESTKPIGLTDLYPNQQEVNLAISRSLPNTTPEKNNSCLPHSPSVQDRGIPKITLNNEAFSPAIDQSQNQSAAGAFQQLNNEAFSPAIDQSQNQNAAGAFRQQLASSQNHMPQNHMGQNYMPQNNTIDYATSPASARRHYKTHWLVALILLTVYFFTVGLAILSKSFGLTKAIYLISIHLVNELFMVMMTLAALHIGIGVAMAIKTGLYLKKPSDRCSFQRLNQFHNRVSVQQSNESTTPILQAQHSMSGYSCIQSENQNLPTFQVQQQAFLQQQQQQQLQQQQQQLQQQQQQQQLQQLQQQQLPLGQNLETMQRTRHLSNQSQGQASLHNQQLNQQLQIPHRQVSSSSDHTDLPVQEGSGQSFGQKRFSFGQKTFLIQQMHQSNPGANSQQIMQQNQFSQMHGHGTNPQMMQQNQVLQHLPQRQIPGATQQTMPQNQETQMQVLDPSQQMMLQNQAQGQIPITQVLDPNQQMITQNQVPQGQVPCPFQQMGQQIGQPMQQSAGQFQAPNPGMLQQYQPQQGTGQFNQPGIGQPRKSPAQYRK